MTTKQIQCLLVYLGYYKGEIDGVIGTLSRVAIMAFQRDFGISDDGIAGSETQKALKHAVAYGMPAKKEEIPAGDPTTEDWWNGVKYFKRREFHCKCGKCGGFPVEPSQDLLRVLDNIREHFGSPVIVSSGVRCPDHNKAVGGASKSQHMYGTAADIKVKGKTPREVAAYCETLLPNTGGIGLYSTWVHVDVRKTKSRWNG